MTPLLRNRMGKHSEKVISGPPRIDVANILCGFTSKSLGQMIVFQAQLSR